MKREAKLKASLMRAMQERYPKFVVIAHTEALRSGVPDWSITGRGQTTWWEFKHAAPNFKSTGIQELTCARLALAGICRYVIWYENEEGGDKHTLIVHPASLADWMNPLVKFTGHDMADLSDAVARYH